MKPTVAPYGLAPRDTNAAASAAASAAAASGGKKKKKKKKSTTRRRGGEGDVDGGRGQRGEVAAVNFNMNPAIGFAILSMSGILGVLTWQIDSALTGRAED